VLDEIVARKRADVAERMERAPYSELREKAVPTERSFGAALKKPGLRFIMECKKASPSEGMIRKNFDIAEIAGAYKNFADAVSVLTDSPYFQGGLDVLRSARGLLDQPILAKDFVIGPYQVCEARVYGADAVLLMLSVLGDAAYKTCADEARRLGMDALTEVHSEEELDRAIRLDAPIIGINNRNLKTLEVDLGVYSRLVKKIREKSPGGIAVCESGIGSRRDVLALKDHADAFLVGSALMKAERIDLAARRLIYGGVKICGLTSPEDAAKAYEAGASFGGVIFAPESPRRVDAAKAREISLASPLPLAGVFVNEEIKKISSIASTVGFSAVQLHGEESGEYVGALRECLPAGCEIWKSARVRGSTMPSGPAFDSADRVLLDTFDEGARGGTGHSFDWSVIKLLPGLSRIIIAGGIGPDNARRASELGCFAIDVNSGVEGASCKKGVKDHRKIENLFKNLRGDI
jgi:indole-3-glycerol phosphate synthase/phosphoribosylanthranilate isomerase